MASTGRPTGDGPAMPNADSYAAYGQPFDRQDDFTEVNFQESRQLDDHMHAAHAMFYSFDAVRLEENIPKRGIVMMQMRFDGTIGFPGGLLDGADDGLEDTISGLNRELSEEMGLNMEKFSIQQTDHVFSHLNHKKRLVLHFYAKEVTKDEFSEIEKGTMGAPDWGTETMGTIRVPLYVLSDGYRGLPVFLANKLCGNAKQQLLETIAKRKILSQDELETVIKAHDRYVKRVPNYRFVAPSMSVGDDVVMHHYASHYCSDYQEISYDFAVTKYSHYTHACHAMLYARDCRSADDRIGGTTPEKRSPFILMHMRFDGFLGFPGGLRDEGESPEEALNRELHEEVGLDETKHALSRRDCLMTHLDEKTKLCLYFYAKQLPWSELAQIEQQLIEAAEYGTEVLGPVRVPLPASLPSSPGDAGCLSTFLTHRFIGNTTEQLLYALRHLDLANNEHILELTAQTGVPGAETKSS